MNTRRVLRNDQVSGLDWLLGAALAAWLPTAAHLPVWTNLGFLAALGWRYAVSYRDWPAPGRVARVAAALLGIGLVYSHFGTLLGRDPGVVLLVWLTGFKFLELKAERDVILAAFLLFLVLVGGFLYEQSLVLGVYGVGCAALIVAVLLRVQDRGRVRTGTRVKIAAILVAQALPIMLLMYVLFPRLPAPLWALPHQGGAVTGMSDEMRPGSIGRLSQSDEVAFRVQFAGAVPAPRERYWRVHVLWDSDGITWRPGAALPRSPDFAARGEPVAYRLTLEPTARRTVPTLDLPARAPPGTVWRAGYLLESLGDAGERKVYALASYPNYEARSLSARERTRALVPPPASDRVQRLAQTWRSGSADDMAVVRAALAYFREQPFAYTLAPPVLDDDPVDQFLFESRRGFCEHYAGAFTTLMRLAGIPARVVIGYQGGTHNPAGDYYIVRQSDAHAWSELWLAGRGWVRVDPTAAVAPERVERGIDAMRLGADEAAAAADVLGPVARRWFGQLRNRARLAWDYANLSWFYWVSEYDEERQERLLARLGLTGIAALVMVGGVLAMTVLYALLTARVRAPRDPIARLYAQYCDRLARLGIPRAAQEGPLAFSLRAKRRRPDLGAAIDRITLSYIAVRYGESRASVSELASAVRGFNPEK